MGGLSGHEQAPTSAGSPRSPTTTKLGLQQPASAGERQDYIPHLDGLRAIAVLGVILYHFEIGPFRGGFTGVDIFFVISGFLMTRRLRHAVHTDPEFTLLSFYKGRWFRLYPAWRPSWQRWLWLG